MQVISLETARRSRALVVVAGVDREQTEAESERWRRRGAVVMRARDAGGCLRMATSVGPDLIVLDRRLRGRLVRLLRAHPVSARARIDWLPEADTGAEPRAA
ncbi:MAG: hypothetical protein JOZ87_11145 [Chloroflexi bacterium]|nr:hypothetical protein [Chloroflexota bacterium]